MIQIEKKTMMTTMERNETKTPKFQEVLFLARYLGKIKTEQAAEGLQV